VTPLKWIGIALLAGALICLGFGARGCSSSKVAAAGLAQAAKTDQAATTAYNEGATHGQESQAQQAQVAKDDAPLDGDNAAVARDRVEVAKHRARPVQPAAGAQPVQGDVAEPAPTLAEVAALQRLTDDLTQDLSDTQKALLDTKTLLATKTAEADSYHQAADGYRTEAAQLRLVVTALSGKVRPWAAGVTYGSNGTAGATVERDLGPFRVGVDVVRRSLGNGNSTLEAMGRLEWSF